MWWIRRLSRPTHASSPCWLMLHDSPGNSIHGQPQRFSSMLLVYIYEHKNPCCSKFGSVAEWKSFTPQPFNNILRDVWALASEISGQSVCRYHKRIQIIKSRFRSKQSVRVLGSQNQNLVEKMLNVYCQYDCYATRIVSLGSGVTFCFVSKRVSWIAIVRNAIWQRILDLSQIDAWMLRRIQLLPNDSNPNAAELPWRECGEAFGSKNIADSQRWERSKNETHSGNTRKATQALGYNKFLPTFQVTSLKAWVIKHLSKRTTKEKNLCSKRLFCDTIIRFVLDVGSLLSVSYSNSHTTLGSIWNVFTSVPTKTRWRLYVLASLRVAVIVFSRRFWWILIVNRVCQLPRSRIKHDINVDIPHFLGPLIAKVPRKNDHDENVFLTHTGSWKDLPQNSEYHSQQRPFMERASERDNFVSKLTRVTLKSYIGRFWKKLPTFIFLCPGCKFD